MAPTPLQGFGGTGRFVIQRQLGAGGMGTVYLAFDNERQSTVALKTMNSIDPTALYRFKREFRSLATIAHPNLVTLYELLSVGGDLFFTMEFVDGLNFIDYVRGDHEADRSLSVSHPASMYLRLRAALAQLVDGVSALHAAGYLHCDIKPSNVLVTRNGCLKLLDFGLVTEVARAPADIDTLLKIIGTPAYMSPEQAVGARLSPASDWYSLGVMLYEALTGRRPFPRRSYAHLASKAEQFDSKAQTSQGAYKQLERLSLERPSGPPSPRALVEHTPEDLDRISTALLNPVLHARPSGPQLRELLGGSANPRAAEAGTPLPTPGAQTTFVGRTSQLSVLSQAFASSRSGQPVVVCVRGESGIGKSFLVKRFLSDLPRDESPTVIFGRCYEQESVPYKALDTVVDALTDYLRQLPRTRSAALMPRDVSLLARLFPALNRAGIVAEAPRRATPDQQELRRRAFGAFRELLARIADRTPLILYIDDVQWGDIESLSMLEETLRPPDPPALLAVLCYQSEEVGRSEFVKGLDTRLGSAALDLDVRYVDVGPLSGHETASLTRSLLGSDAGAIEPSTIEAISTESAGHPYFLRELTDYIRSRTDTAGSASPHRRVTLDEVLSMRLSRLPDGARSLLDVVAIAAKPISQRVANAAAGLARGDRSTAALLRASHLVRAGGKSGDDAIEIYQDRIREVAVRNLGAQQRVGCHLRVAQALEHESGADLETLAEHYEAAGRLQKAGQYARGAAQNAANALAFERAARLYERVLKWQIVPAEEERALRVSLGDALANAGRGAEAAASYLAAATGASADIALEWRRRAAQQLLISGHVDAGLDVMRQVLQAVGLKLADTPRRALLSLLWGRFKLALRGLSFTERSENLISPQELRRVDVCWSVAVGLALVDFIRSSDFQSRHLLLALSAGEPLRVARALAIEAGIRGAGGGGRRQRQIAETALALAERLDSHTTRAIHSLTAGSTEYYRGRWRRSLELEEGAEQAILEHSAGAHWELQTARLYQVVALFHLGEIATLAERVKRFIVEARERGNLYAATIFRTGFANLAWLAADDVRGARQMLEDSVAQWSSKGFHVQHYLAMLAEGQLNLYEERGDEAWRTLSKSWTLLTGSLMFRNVGIKIVMRQLRARCAVSAAATSTSGRVRWLACAERETRRLEAERFEWSRALAALVRASIATLRGDRHTAIGVLTRAAVEFDRLEMALHAASARRRLGELSGDAELVERADRWMRSQQIQDPRRMTGMLAPAIELRS